MILSLYTFSQSPSSVTYTYRVLHNLLYRFTFCFYRCFVHGFRNIITATRVIVYIYTGKWKNAISFDSSFCFYLLAVSPRALEKYIEVGSVLGHIGRSHGSKLRIRNAYDRAANLHETSVALQY